jgi:hypothetical protein
MLWYSIHSIWKNVYVVLFRFFSGCEATTSLLYMAMFFNHCFFHFTLPYLHILILILWHSFSRPLILILILTLTLTHSLSLILSYSHTLILTLSHISSVGKCANFVMKQCWSSTLKICIVFDILVLTLFTRVSPRALSSTKNKIFIQLIFVLTSNETYSIFKLKSLCCVVSCVLYSMLYCVMLLLCCILCCIVVCVDRKVDSRGTTIDSFFTMERYSPWVVFDISIWSQFCGLWLWDETLDSTLWHPGIKGTS